MSVIKAERLTMIYGDKTLFQALDFSIDEQNIGLIGRNGTGKSTLLKLISGQEVPFEGSILKSDKMVIGYLPQDPPIQEDATVLEQIFASDSKEMNRIRRYEQAVTAMEHDPYNPSLQAMLNACTQEMDGADAWAMESQIKSVLTKLGIDDFSKAMGSLSGGQQKRVALAAALVNPCDLLLMDEPTNHLDSETIDWLETYLNNRKGPLVIITHDRYFLDRVTNTIFELEDKNLHVYEGNYAYYLDHRFQRQQRARSIEEKISRLYKQELQWMRQGAKARSTKQKARIQRFEQLENTLPNLKQNEMVITSPHKRLGKKIVELDKVSKAYDQQVVLQPFSYVLQRDDRIGIVGKNGMGKTTLFELISGQLSPDSGTLQWGETVRIGYYTQTVPFQDEGLRAIDYIRQTAEFVDDGSGQKISVSDMMERFLFTSEEQYTPIVKLSGGEKRRLYLLQILISAPNVLLLDEPTNDLDIPTLQILEEYIDGFPGPVLAISHDRYFLDRIANKIFSFPDLGVITVHTGNYFDYVEERKSAVIPSAKETASKGSTPRRGSPDPSQRKRTFKEQRELENIERTIPSLEERLDQVDAALGIPSSDFTVLSQLNDEKQSLEEKLLELMEREETLKNIEKG